MEVTHLSAITPADADLVLLDLDNTLYDYHRCHERALQAVCSACAEKFPVSAEQARALYQQSRKKINTRLNGTAVSHSRLFYLQDMAELLRGKTDPDLTITWTNLYWDTFIADMELFPGSLDFLEKCRLQPVITVLVTDMTTEIQFRKLEKLGISDYFNYIVTSEEAGVEKPHPFIFELAIAKARRIQPEIHRILLVGDDQKKDQYCSELADVRVVHLVK